MNFFAELKRRNVFRAGAFYAAGAWLLVQVATQVFPFFHISEWVVRWIIVAAVIGFPFWLALAWFYEWTAHGLQRESDSPTPLSPSSRASRRNVDRWIVVMLAAAVVLLLVDKFLFRDQPAKAASVPEKSIAVLPFDNLSRDPDNAYFVEGIQDEILTRLAKIADLKVIARSSTQRFQNKSDLPQIARQLGVAHILEGSVQKASDQVRVNVQLINALTEAHLWADTYDRKLTDIFAVESEIATKIADTLQARFTGSEKNSISKKPTENAHAHELYLKGRYFWNKRTGEDLKRAAQYFTQATAADPNYALAYAGLADAYVLMPNLGAGAPWEAFPKAETAARRALQLDENLAEAHTSLACVLWYHDLDYTAAEKEFQRAIALNPNYATAHQWYGDNLLTSVGRFDEAIGELKRALELDPLSLIVHTDLANTYRCAQRGQEALRMLHRALEIDPNFYYAHRSLGQVFEGQGEFEKAIGEYQKARSMSEDTRIVALLAHAYGVSGNREEAAKLLELLKAQSQQRYVSAYSFAMAYLGLGEGEKVLDALEQSFRDGAGSDIGRIKVEPLWDPLRGDPRFEELARKVFAKVPAQNTR